MSPSRQRVRSVSFCINSSTMLPVLGTSALVRDRRNKDLIVANAIEDGVGKSIQNEPAFTALSDWISLRSFHDSFDRVIDLEREGLCGDFAAGLVPIASFG